MLLVMDAPRSTTLIILFMVWKKIFKIYVQIQASNICWSISIYWKLDSAQKN